MWTRSLVAFLLVLTAHHAASAQSSSPPLSEIEAPKKSPTAVFVGEALEYLRAGCHESGLECFRCAFDLCAADRSISRTVAVAQHLEAAVREVGRLDRLRYLRLADQELALVGAAEGRASIAMDLAEVLSEGGEFAEAAGVLARAFVAARDAGVEARTLHRLAGRLANARLDSSELSLALAAARTSLDYALVIAEDHDLDCANALLVLANVESTLGEDEEALAVLDTALTVAADQEVRALILTSRIESAKALGRLDDARRSADELKEVAAELEDEEIEIQALLAEIELLDPKSQRVEREAQLARARDLATRADRRDLLTLVRGTESWMRYVQGEYTSARALALDTVREYERVDALESTFTCRDTVVRAALALRDLDGAREAVLACRDVARRALERVGPNDTAALRRRYIAASELEQDLVALETALYPDRAADAARRGFGAAQRTKALELIEARARAIASEPVKVSSASASREFERVTLETPNHGAESVQTALGDERTGLIEYAHGDSRLFAYCVTSSGLARYELGDWAAIEARAREFVTAVAARGDRASAIDVARIGHELHQHLLAPMLRTAPSISRWVVVPTPGLSILPFDALLTAPVPESPQLPGFEAWPFVVRSVEIDLCPSSTFAVQLAQAPTRQRARRALVVAAPSYSHANGKGPRSGAADPAETWDDLRGATREAQSIANQLVTEVERARNGELKSFLTSSRLPSGPLRGESLDLFVGPSATLEAIAKADERYSVIYCIAHGRVDLRQPERTAIVFPNALGGVDHLTCDRVAELHLDADLVVLSSCETAVGKAQRGEGVLSLAHAFLRARARGVIASLWKVDDDRTASLFEGVYSWRSPGGTPRSTSFHAQVFVDGVPPATALHEAKLHAASATRGEEVAAPAPGLARRVDRSDPYCWAAFVYIGAVRPRP